MKTLISSLWLAITITAQAAERPAEVTQCEVCHGQQGHAAQPGWPPLAGQSKAALQSKLRSYREQWVNDSVMSRGSHDFSDEQIEALAEYYSKLPQPE
jgi:cytochrome c553